MMAAPALCTGCSGWFSRIARLFQVFQAFQEGPTLLQVDPLRVSGWSGCNWTSLGITGHHWMSLDWMQLEESGHLVGMSGQFQNIWS